MAEDVHLQETATADPSETGEPNTSDRIKTDEDGQTQPVAKDSGHNVPLARSTRLRKSVKRYGVVPSCLYLGRKTPVSFMGGGWRMC